MAQETGAFSIHQELWHDAWVAGTSSVRARRSMAHVALNVEQRVAQLLHEYGPRSGKPLTLRVYGTLMKGFSVINNERARALHGDCERVVLLFSERPVTEEASKGMKLPASKRQRVDALTLDLDIAKVQESEAFDWSQAPLDDNSLMPLLALQEGPCNFEAISTPAATQNYGAIVLAQPSVPSLLEQAPLLDEAFPAIEGPSAADEATTLATPAAAAAAAAATGNKGTRAPVTPTGEPAAVPDAATHPEAVPAPEQQEQQVAVAADVEGTAAQMSPPKRRRFFKGVPRPPVPGYVFGFDEHPVMLAEAVDEWNTDAGPISRQQKTPADYAVGLTDEASVDHLGPLRLFINPPSTVLFGPEAAAFAAAIGDVDQPAKGLEAGQWPAHSEKQNGHLEGDHAQTSKAKRAKSKPMSDDLFRPYDPDTPLRSAEDAVAELAGLLSGPPALDDGFDGQDEAPTNDQAEAYDAHTAQVGTVFRRIVAKGQEEGKQVTVDDLAPVGTTDRATAARTFHALLTLATAGHLVVAQTMPYGAIGVSLP